MQRRNATYQIQAEAAWERTCFSQSIDTRHQQSVDTRGPQSIDINNTTSTDNHPIPKTTVSEKDKSDKQYLTLEEFGIFRDPDGHAKAINGRTLHVSRENIADILQTANGADNLFMHHHNNPEKKVTKEFYDTAGGINNSFIHKLAIPFSWEEKDEYGIYRDDQGCARGMDGHTISISKENIRRLLERASKDEPNYICLPEHANLFTHTKLLPEIYTKDEINKMFYGFCGEQENNKEAFQMKLDGVYHPLNDSIGWLTTCLEEIRQDITRIQQATEASCQTSIDIRHHASIDCRSPTSIDPRLPTSIDISPPHSHPKQPQHNFHTREEIDQLVEEIYRALETTEERLDGRSDDIYFPMDLSITALTYKIEAMQRELVEIQRYIARRLKASASIDSRTNNSIYIRHQTSADDATNRGRLVPKMKLDMSDKNNHGEETSADTYATLRRHQFNIESLEERLQRMENTTATMKAKWRRGDEAMRDFTGTWFNKRKEEMDSCFPESSSFQHY
ncbi:hypothetical protein IGI04_036103 [Brassica rapa subsp. trilocularis]|uniref:Uncharacterized protein n=1 Tax=Brassica rapa subsp. trilocularis TaxID=1813537 RepID=A0ABQ7LDI3_BRACM|nr:hypothetical protein IGI04_036103 [Brassica rapa subsp. trilocularis]